MLAHFEIKRGPRSSNVSCVRSIQQHLLTHKLQYFWKAGASWFKGIRGGPSGRCPQHRGLEKPGAAPRAAPLQAGGDPGSSNKTGQTVTALSARQTNKPSDTTNRAGAEG